MKTKEPIWTTADGKKLKYRELEDGHLKNIIKDGYRNPWIELEAQRRGFEVPDRAVDKISFVDLMMWIESFNSVALSGNKEAERMAELWETNKRLFFLKLNQILEDDKTQ